MLEKLDYLCGGGCPQGNDSEDSELGDELVLTTAISKCLALIGWGWIEEVACWSVIGWYC